jgi:hypothetical protein
LYLDQVREGYQEQDRRSERYERRATPLLGGISTISAVVAAASGILASSDVLNHGTVRVALGLAILAVILCFGAAARWALSVLTSRDAWRRPATGTMLRERANRRDRDLYVHSVAALIDSIQWNQRIANYKGRRLRNASGWFAAGLTLLLVTVVAFVLLTVLWPAAQKERVGPRGLQGPIGPAGPEIRSVVQRPHVRVVLATRVLRARPRARLNIRYAVTQPSAVIVSVERSGRSVMPEVADAAAFGTNATTVRAPSKGRYLMRIVVRATNGTTGGADAVLLVRPRRDGSG